MSDSILKKIILRIGREVALRFNKKSARFPNSRKVVSFTFDDFPVTAVNIGARLLESNGARGTFYSSLGIAGEDSPVGRIASIQDMLKLNQCGHELACHTYSHLKCAFRSSRSIINDCKKNQELARKIGDITLNSFAYPNGSFDPMSKLTISRMYSTARTIIPGINVNKIDLSSLFCLDIGKNIQWVTILKWIEKLDDFGGWLIINIHDISNNPTNYGCPIDLFYRMTETVVKKDFEIMTVSKAADLTFSSS